MNLTWHFVAIILAATLSPCPAFAIHSRLSGADGECIFTHEFMQDYAVAQEQVNQLKSAEPLLTLLKKYKKTEEQAELQLSIGLVYNQRTGIVDPAKAVTHLSLAMKFDFPEETYIEICMWRGGSYEQLKRYPEAIRDYLRGLLACSYRDLSGGWPEIERPEVPFYINSDDPENAQRARDYHRYRIAIDLKRFLLMQRFYLIEAIKRVQAEGSIDDKTIEQTVRELSPDKSRHDLIVGFLKSENKRPWP